MASFDDSFRAFHEQHWALLVEHCRRDTANIHAAEDAASNAFLSLLIARSVSASELYAIANTELSHQPKDLLTPHPSRYMAPTATPEESAMHSEHKRRIHEAFLLLPDLWRTVLMLSLHGVQSAGIGRHLKRHVEDIDYIWKRTMFHLRRWCIDPTTRPQRDTP
jgi:DNA-directed RNA polymerase specialized sigma24 family protein